MLREQLLPPELYERRRAELRPRVLAMKAARRFHLDDRLTFLFENAFTLLYQVQEVVRAEGLRSERSLQGELDTYNQLLAQPGALGCTLLLELADDSRRGRELDALEGAAGAAYLRLPSGQRVQARPRGERVPRAGVHFLAFPSATAPLALGVAGPLQLEAPLPPPLQRALEQDLLDPPQGTTLLALLGEGSPRCRPEAAWSA